MNQRTGKQSRRLEVGQLSLVSIVFRRNGWVMKLSIKVRANFMTATHRFLIIMNSPLSVLLIHIGWWRNPWNRKFPARSMGVATYQRRWTLLVIRNCRSQRKRGPFAWTLFESQITNEDPSCVLSNVLFILITASVTDTFAGFEGKTAKLRHWSVPETAPHWSAVLEWQS